MGRFCIEEQLGVTQCQSSAFIVLYSIALTIGSRLGGCCPAKDRYRGRTRAQIEGKREMTGRIDNKPRVR